MILLYSNELSEHVQTIFDLNKETPFDVLDCVRYAEKYSPSYLLPKNIETGIETDKFILEVEKYLRQLIERYLNESRPIKAIQKAPHKLIRIDSVNYSLACNNYIFKLAAINIKDNFKSEYFHRAHGGYIEHKLITISIYNYFLLNYFPENISLPEEKKFIRLTNVNITDGIYLNNAGERLDTFIFDNIDRDSFIKVINLLLYNINLFNSIIDNSIGIVLNIVELDELINKFSKIKNPITEMTHMVSFIRCNKGDSEIEFFYDNMGVNENENVVEYDYLTGIDDNERFIDLPDFDRKKKSKVLTKFNWKTYLKTKIETNKDKLEQLLISADISRVMELKDIILDFSECFYVNNPKQNMPVKRYKNNIFIYSFHVITMHKLTTEDDYKKLTEQTSSIYKTIYSNNKSQQD